MEPVSDAVKCFEQMLILEKYERVIAYLYPIAQSIPRKHGIARDMFLTCLLGIPEVLHHAGKSKRVSEIYSVEAALSNLRFWMRFLVSIHCMTPHQLQTAQLQVAEVGQPLVSWIKTRRRKGQAGK